jgi:hypothetical protein
MNIALDMLCASTHTVPGLHDLDDLLAFQRQARQEDRHRPHRRQLVLAPGLVEPAAGEGDNGTRNSGGEGEGLTKGIQNHLF